MSNSFVVTVTLICPSVFYICPYKIFQEIGAVQSLKRIVMYSSNGTASALAKRALSMMGEEVPKRIPSCVPNWKTCEVQTWLQQVGFSAYCDRFQVSQTNKDGYKTLK